MGWGDQRQCFEGCVLHRPGGTSAAGSLGKGSGGEDSRHTLKTQPKKRHSSFYSWRGDLRATSSIESQVGTRL